MAPPIVTIFPKKSKPEKLYMLISGSQITTYQLIHTETVKLLRRPSVLSVLYIYIATTIQFIYSHIEPYHSVFPVL